MSELSETGTEQPPEEAKVQSAARLFDVRNVIGGLFTAYGIIMTLVGVFDGKSAVAKAEGIRINLWLGLVMLAFGLLVLLWRTLAPPKLPDD
jgi:hypothetical protein